MNYRFLILALCVWFCCKDSGDGDAAYQSAESDSRKPNPCRELTHGKAELDFSVDNVKVDSVLYARFSYLCQIIDSGLLDRHSNDMSELHDTLNLLQEITGIMSQRDYGYYGVTYTLGQLEDDFLKWHRWCVENAHKLAWDEARNTIYNRHFASRGELLDLVFGNYFLFLQRASKEEGFLVTDSQVTRLHESLEFFESITKIRSKSLLHSDGTYANRNYLDEDIRKWLSWYERNKFKLKWNVREMRLISAMN